MTSSFLFPCYSELLPEQLEPSDQHLILVYTSLGYDSLQSACFSSSLKYFQTAASLLDQSKDDLPELKTLILFGQVIAYDNLGLNADSLSHLHAMQSTFNKGCSSIPTENDDCNLSLIEVANITSELRFLAALSPSEEIREALDSITSQMFETIQEDLLVKSQYKIEKKIKYSCPELRRAKWMKKYEKFIKNLYNIFEKIKEVYVFFKGVGLISFSQNQLREDAHVC